MKKNLVIILCITLFGAVMRLFMLGTIPNGLYQDETAIGYNAYSLLKTGKDEFGKFLPLYFASFGDWKLPVYIYFTVPSIALFHLTSFAVRFPSALFGTLTIPMLYFMVREWTKNSRISLLSAFILCITPWHIHYSRATFEVSLVLFFFVTGMFLIKRATTNANPYLHIVGILLFTLASYSYNLTRILSPILLLITYYFSSFNNSPKKTPIKRYICIFIVTLIPMILTVFQNGGISSASGTLINSSAEVQSKLIEYRSYMSVLPAVIQKIFFNTTLLTLNKYYENITAYFDSSFFFVSGSSHGNHGIGTNGLFYSIFLPILILGCIQIYKQKLYWQYFLLIVGGVTILIASLTREAPHATRSYPLLLPIVVIIALGLEKIYLLNKTMRIKHIMLLNVTLIVTLIWQCIYFGSSYLFRFPISYAQSWHSADIELAKSITDYQDTVSSIIIGNDTGLLYTSLAFYLAVDPLTFQKTIKRSTPNAEGFYAVQQFEKFVFKPIDWQHDRLDKKTLIIAKPGTVPNTIPNTVTIYYPERPVVFAKDQQIINYPIREPAYVIVPPLP